MKVIGLSAGVVDRDSNVDRMVKAIMRETGFDTEFVKLTDIDYAACKGCAWLCAGPQVCQLDDDLFPYLPMVGEADAVVLGSPSHFGTICATMASFVSRLWGYRHVDIPIAHKPFILATCASGVGEASNDKTEEDFRRALKPFRVDVLDVVKFISRVPPCYRCGRHQECVIGGAYKFWGTDVHTLTITPDLFQNWEDCPETVVAVKEAATKIKAAVQTPA